MACSASEPRCNTRLAKIKVRAAADVMERQRDLLALCGRENIPQRRAAKVGCGQATNMEQRAKKALSVTQRRSSEEATHRSTEAAGRAAMQSEKETDRICQEYVLTKAIGGACRAVNAEQRCRTNMMTRRRLSRTPTSRMSDPAKVNSARR